MILEALQNTISGICTAYALIGDVEAVTPFAVYNASPTILRDKSGIVGYEYDVTISVVDPDIDQVMLKASGIKIAVDLLEDTTVQGTTFDIVHFSGESQRFDANALTHINDISYRIITQNV